MEIRLLEVPAFHFLALSSALQATINMHRARRSPTAAILLVFGPFTMARKCTPYKC